MKYSSFAEYVQHVNELLGSDLAVSRYLGYTHGGRIGQVRAGRGVFDATSCMKLARLTGDNPIDVLRLAGYTEMADLMVGHVSQEPSSLRAGIARQLETLKAMVEAQLTLVRGTMPPVNGNTNGEDK